MPNASYHHTQQLRVKHLKTGELIKFTYDVLTPPWTKRDGTPGEQSVVFGADTIYRKVSPRKIQACKAYWGSNLQAKVSPLENPKTLGRGQTDLPVTDQVHQF